MTASERFWRGLEAVGGLVGTRAHWEFECGKENGPALNRLLHPTPGQADWFPDPDDRFQRLRVWVNPTRPSEMEAVSEEDPPHRDPLPIKRADVALYQLDFAQLARDTAKALGMPAAGVCAEFAPRVAQIGVLMGKNRRVFLAVCQDADGLAGALSRIITADISPFVLLTPADACLDAAVRGALQSAKANHFRLVDLVEVVGGGQFRAPSSLDSVVADARSRDGQGLLVKIPFEKPSGANWPDVRIVFQDDHTAWMGFGETGRVFHFREIQGFGKTVPKEEPTAAWTFLRAYALKNGELPCLPTREEQERNRNYRRSLAIVLRRFFGCSQAPFQDIKGKHLSKALFTVKAKFSARE